MANASLHQTFFNVNVLDSVQIQAAFTQGIPTLKNREITVTGNSN